MLIRTSVTRDYKNADAEFEQFRRLFPVWIRLLLGRRVLHDDRLQRGDEAKRPSTEYVSFDFTPGQLATLRIVADEVRAVTLPSGVYCGWFNLSAVDSRDKPGHDASNVSILAPRPRSSRGAALPFAS